MAARGLTMLRAHARWVLLGAAAVVLVVHSLAYNFVTDDAYISFVYSRNLAEHGELAFNLGDAVEGYTNFSWTVVLAGLMKLGIPPELASRVLGTGCALVTLWLAMRITARALGRRSAWAGVPPLLLALSSGYACWSSGGLETQLFTLLATAALDAVVAAAVPASTAPRAIAIAGGDDAPELSGGRPLRRVGWLIALAAMTRPEGLLIGAVLAVVWIVHRVVDGRARPDAPRAITDELWAVGWFLAVWAPWFAWRWRHYGYLAPNTYYVKAHGPWTHPGDAHEMLVNGLYYVWIWLRQTALLYVLPVVALGWIGRPRTPRFVAGLGCALIAIAYLGYAISVGGDFMGLHRFIMPVFVVAALAVVLGAERVTGWLGHEGAAVRARAVTGLLGFAAASAGFVAAATAFGVAGLAHWAWFLVAAALGGVLAWRTSRQLALVAGVALVAGFAATQLALTRRSLDRKNLAAYRGVIDTPAFLEVYTEDRAKIGRATAPCFRDDDFSIVGGAGAQPYYARMRAIDVFGLVSERIAHEEPRRRPRAGHTKWGSNALLASYHPTFVFSCYTIHRTAAQPQLACATWWRARGYEEVTIHVPGLEERGEYYTFLARSSPDVVARFGSDGCPARVR